MAKTYVFEYRTFSQLHYCMLQLEPQYLIIVRDILSKYVPEMTVWAYGSRVAGNAHAGSDLDLVILNNHNPDIVQSDLVGLRTAFSESDLPISVDIHDWATISDSFKAAIIKKHFEF